MNKDKLVRFIYCLLKEMPIAKLEPLLVQADTAPKIEDFHLGAITKKAAQQIADRLLAPDLKCQVKTCSTPYTNVKTFKNGRHGMKLTMCEFHRSEQRQTKISGGKQINSAVLQ